MNNPLVITDRQQLDALNDSIKHWDQNAKVTDLALASIAPTACALCRIYNNPSTSVDCVGCPVYKHTGKPGCRGTPYEEARGILMDWRNTSAEWYQNELKERFLVVAHKEADFLRSLLPEPAPDGEQQ